MLPNLLELKSGGMVTAPAEWPARRAEIVDTLASEVFGRAPLPGDYTLDFVLAERKPYFEGKALYKRIDITLTAALGKYTFPLVVITPVCKAACPAFLHISNRFPADRPPYEPVGDFSPAALIVSRGYAACYYYTVDVSPDENGRLSEGVCAIFPRSDRPDEWNTIAAWAFAASRALDYLETDGDIDASRVALIGHSRAGKTALWAGACDPRFAMVVSNESGCTGAALERGKVGERTRNINEAFPYWFCQNYKNYNDRSEDLPFDFHWLVAASAPRAVCVSSASLDQWADPKAEFLSCHMASPAWEVFGKKGLVAPSELPGVNTAWQQGWVSYHLREGEHDLALFDWERFVDFADARI